MPPSAPTTTTTASSSSSSSSTAPSRSRFPDLHYVWAFGHIILLGSFIRLTLALPSILFGKSGLIPYSFWYRAAYVGALVSYTIVVKKSIGFPRNLAAVDKGYLTRALMDDNVQYFILAMYWAISKPVYISLLPFATFSLFHCLTFLRTNVLPKFYPRSAPPSARPTNPNSVPEATTNAVEKLGKTIHLWVKGNYDSAMKFVAYAELGILAWVCLKAVTFRGSFLAPIFILHFLRVRYLTSSFTRQVVLSTTAHVDNFFQKRTPPAVANAWDMAKRFMTSWMGSVVQGPAGGAGAQGPAAAGEAAGRAAGGANGRR